MSFQRGMTLNKILTRIEYLRCLSLWKIPVLVFMEISGVVNALMFIGVEKI